MVSQVKDQLRQVNPDVLHAELVKQVQQIREHINSKFSADMSTEMSKIRGEITAMKGDQAVQRKKMKESMKTMHKDTDQRMRSIVQEIVTTNANDTAEQVAENFRNMNAFRVQLQQI